MDLISLSIFVKTTVYQGFALRKHPSDVFSNESKCVWVIQKKQKKCNIFDI